MNDYIKPCIRESTPDHIIFYVGINNLPLNKDPNNIAQLIIRLAKSVVTDNRDVTVSNITPRNDQWKNKVTEVNDCLISMCRDENIPFINYTNVIDTKKNLNNSKLHLNTKGYIEIRDNFAKYLRNLSSWNNARSYFGSNNGVGKKGEAFSCVNNEDPLEDFDFGTSSEGISLDLHSLSNIRRNNVNRLILALISINPLSANPTKWSNTLKQFVDELFECVRPFCGVGAQRVNSIRDKFDQLVDSVKRKSIQSTL